MTDNLWDLVDLSGTEEIEDQKARDMRWRMWAIDRATEAYGSVTGGNELFYPSEFFGLADRIYRWVAKLDDTAAVFENSDDPKPHPDKIES